MRWTPRNYQLEAAKFMLERPAAGLLLAPGLGKTSTTLAALAALKGTDQLESALIIAPLRPLYDVWPAERAKWDDFALLSMQLLHGPHKERALATPADVYVINPEGLDWLFAASRRRPKFNVLVVDESTKFKSASAQRAKLLRSVIDRFDRRYILTGTPSPNGVEDLWGQVYLLDGGERLGRFVTHFRRRYMMNHAPQGVAWSDWRPVVGAAQEIQERVSDICMALRAEDYLDMPELITNDVMVRLPAHAAKVYREVRDDFLAQLSAGTVTVANAAAKTAKMRQAANGFLYTDEGTAEHLHDAKVDALDELVEESAGDPLLVAVAFLSEARALAERYGAPYLGGGVPHSAASRTIARWNAGEVPVLIAHPASVAHGLNLQSGGRAVCWFGLSYNREEYDQFVARVYRQGQSRGVVVHRIVSQGTVDEVILQALASKDATQKSFINALRRVP